MADMSRHRDLEHSYLVPFSGMFQSPLLGLLQVSHGHMDLKDNNKEDEKLV